MHGSYRAACVTQEGRYCGALLARFNKSITMSVKQKSPVSLHRDGCIQKGGCLASNSLWDPHQQDKSLHENKSQHGHVNLFFEVRGERWEKMMVLVLRYLFHVILKYQFFMVRICKNLEIRNNKHLVHFRYKNYSNQTTHLSIIIKHASLF